MDLSRYFLKKPNLVGRQAGFMSLGTFLSRILGFIRDLLIAAFFSKTETDVFFVAFRFPNFFRRLLGEGSFSASVTPALTESLQMKSKEQVKEIHSCLFTLLFCLTIVLSLFGVLFMEHIMNLFFANSSYASIEGKLEKTIVVGRLVFSYLFFVSLYSYFMSVAQVFGKFFIPALAPAFFNLSLIVFAWTPHSWWPFPSLSLAWAVIAGGLLQLAPVLYEMRKLDFFPRFCFKWKNPALTAIGKRFLPGMLGLSGLSLIGLINVYFSAWLEEGAPSYIYYGDRLMEFPRALIAVSIGTALIPDLTRKYSLEKISDFKATLSRYLAFLLFLTLPCSVIFLFFSQPIVELLFGRGEFDSLSVLKTSMVLQIYSAVLIFSSLSRILSSGFFAINKNWHVVICTALFVIVHLFCAWYFTLNYGLQGLAGATALSALFYFLVLTVLLSYLLKGLEFGSLFFVLMRNLPGLILLALTLLAFPFIKSMFLLFLAPFWSLFLSLFLLLFFGGGLYLFSALLLKEPMARELVSLFLKRQN